MEVISNQTYMVNDPEKIVTFKNFTENPVCNFEIVYSLEIES